MVEVLEALQGAGEHPPVKDLIASISDLIGHVIATVLTQHRLEAWKP